MIQFQKFFISSDARVGCASSPTFRRSAVVRLQGLAQLARLLLLALAGSGLVSGCGGGAIVVGDGVSASLNVPVQGGNGTEVLSVVVNEPPGRNCARGGSRVDSGLDVNRNEVLEAREVSTTRYVCNA